MTTINSDEIDQRIAAITRKIEKTQRAATFRPALQKSADEIEETMKDAPRKAQGAFSRLATPAQRRAYWARVRSGEAEHSDSGGYVRQGSANKWEGRVTDTKAVISNPVDHARYVWGRSQQPFHAVSRWPQGDDVLQSKADVIVGFFEDALEKALRDDT